MRFSLVAFLFGVSVFAASPSPWYPEECRWSLAARGLVGKPEAEIVAGLRPLIEEVVAAYAKSPKFAHRLAAGAPRNHSYSTEIWVMQDLFGDLAMAPLAQLATSADRGTREPALALLATTEKPSAYAAELLSEAMDRLGARWIEIDSFELALYLEAARALMNVSVDKAATSKGISEDMASVLDRTREQQFHSRTFPGLPGWVELAMKVTENLMMMDALHPSILDQARQARTRSIQYLIEVQPRADVVYALRWRCAWLGEAILRMEAQEGTEGKLLTEEVQHVLSNSEGLPYFGTSLLRLRLVSDAILLRGDFQVPAGLEAVLLKATAKYVADLKMEYPAALQNPADSVSLDTLRTAYVEFVEGMRYARLTDVEAFRSILSASKSLPYFRSSASLATAYQRFPADCIQEVLSEWGYVPGPSARPRRIPDRGTRFQQR